MSLGSAPPLPHRPPPLYPHTRVPHPLQVIPQPTISGFVVSGANRLPQRVIQEALAGMQGKTLNKELVYRVKRLNDWYEDNGVWGKVSELA